MDSREGKNELSEKTDEITVYIPNKRLKAGFFKAFLEMFKNIILSRELIWQLFRRDFLMAYKRSFLGQTWIFISPLVGIFSWLVLNFAGVLKPGDLGVPYPVYVLIGSSIWGLFMAFHEAAVGTLMTGTELIAQIRYSHESLFIKQVGQALANFLLSFVMNLLVILFFGVRLRPEIFLLPVLFFPLFFLAAGPGLIRAIIAVVLPDVDKGLTVLVSLLMYITPVVYSPDVQNPLLKTVVRYNPLTYLVGAPRDLVLYGKYAYWPEYGISTGIVFLLFLLCWKMFYIAEERVIEKIL